jgi:hypothetical protein
VAVDYSRAGLAAAAGVDPWSLSELVRSGDATALQDGAVRARQAGALATQAVADGARADRGSAAAFANSGAAVFDADASTRRGAVLLADRGEKIEETARAVLDVAAALSEAVTSTRTRLSTLDADLTRIISLRNTFVATGPDAAAAAEQRFFGMAVDAVRRVGRQVRSDLDAYEAMLDNRAARIAGLGYGAPAVRPADAAAVVVLPAPPVPPVIAADVILTILALLIAAVSSSSGPGEPDVPAPPAPAPPADRAAPEQGALGGEYVPGVHDSNGLFLPKERSVADWIVEHEPGARVDPRPVDNTQEGVANPDVIVRRGPDDPGTISEIKTLAQPTNNAVKDRILDAAGQVRQPGGGDVYIDGRAAGLTEEEAVRGYRRAAGVGDELPRRTTILLGNGEVLEFEG